MPGAMAPPRRKGPALYELLGSRPVNKPGGSRAPIEDTSEPEEDSAFGIKPGRSIRVPVGYLFFAIAALIALIIGGYMLGYHQRDRIAEQERLRMLTSDDPDSGGFVSDTSGRGSTITDPLNQSRNPRSTDTARTPNQGNTGGQSGNQTGSRTGSPLPNVWFVRDGVADPRETGRNYFMLATNYPWDEAEKAALFLGQNGIGTVVFPSSRSNRWNVCTRQGFTGGTFRDQEAQELVDRIKQLGQRYRSEERGATDFDDLYPALYN